jgi:hypothetical protein
MKLSSHRECPRQLRFTPMNGSHGWSPETAREANRRHHSTASSARASNEGGTTNPKPNVKTAPAVVVFGKDEEGKARAARFRPDEAEKAIKAAASMKMRVLKVNSEEADTVAGQLPLGRIYAGGIGFVPPVEEVYLQRLEELVEPKAAPGLPKNWDAIVVGHLVVAQDPDDDAWYPAKQQPTQNHRAFSNWHAQVRKGKEPLIGS